MLSDWLVLEFSETSARGLNDLRLVPIREGIACEYISILSPLVEIDIDVAAGLRVRYEKPTLCFVMGVVCAGAGANPGCWTMCKDEQSFTDFS